PAAQTGVADAGLCHGSAGLAHLFGLMYQMTSEPALADAARFWVGRTLELCSAVTAGGATPAGATAPGCKGPGLLEGTAGVALAPAAPPARGYRRQARVPGCPVRRLTQPGGSGRPVAKGARQREGARHRAVAGLIPHAGRGPAHSVRPFRWLHGGQRRRAHPPEARRPGALPPPYPPGRGLSV